MTACSRSSPFRLLSSALRLLLLLLALPVAAQKPVAWRAKNVQAVDAWTQVQRSQAAANTNLWVARGVVANRATHQVQAIAEATGLEKDAIVEFLAVGETSEKDYEALTISLAHASDIARGLEFVGVPRGRTINTALCQFWSKGERVEIAVRPFDAPPATDRPLAACLVDKRTTQPLPTSFIYTGSRWSGDAANPVCRADDSAPGAIVSTYNEPTVVLDVPEEAPQSEVYGNRLVAPAGAFEAGRLLFLTFSPEPRAGSSPRVADVRLEIHPSSQPAATNAALAGLACVTRGDGLPAATTNLAGALARLESLAKTGRDPYVTVSLDESLTLAVARDLARVLKTIEGPGGIRIEPPPAGQLFYRAFLPDENWRTRSARLSQPWELHFLHTTNGTWQATLTQIIEDWSQAGKLEPDLTVKEHPLARIEELPGTIAALGGGLNTLFVFAPPNAPLSVFMPAVRLVHETQPTVFVFAE